MLIFLYWPLNVPYVFYLFQKLENAHIELVIHTCPVQSCITSDKWFIISSLMEVECCYSFLTNPIFHALIHVLLGFCSEC